MSNGTLVSVGGTPREVRGPSQRRWIELTIGQFYPGNSGDVGDGFQGLRLFTPCDDDRVSPRLTSWDALTGDQCDVYEDPQTLRLTSTRWYPSTVRIGDGSILIIGGMRNAGFK